MKIAVLDDWQGVAEQYGDWATLRQRAEVQFFQKALPEEEAATALAGFDVLLTMQSRTALPASLLKRLPSVKLVGITISNALLDLNACKALGITVSRTDAPSTEAGWAPAELALGVMLSSFRGLAKADSIMREGGFQEGVPVGRTLAGKTLGIVGFGRLGSRLALYGKALGMKVVAWSAHLDEGKAAEIGVLGVSRKEVFSETDIVSIHLTLNDDTRGLIGEADLRRMRPGALLVNTSRGPIVDEAALLSALENRRIAAALDVFDQEPLPADHPLRHLDNVVLTPHLGYGVEEAWRTFYPQSIENVLAFLDGNPVRVVDLP